MDEQEALERCDMLINGFSINNSMYEAFKDNENGYPTFNKMKEFTEVCKDALKKQIAKKPIIKQWCPAICPCCGCDLSESIGDGYYKHYTSLKFCECGQKLDWSEV